MTVKPFKETLYRELQDDAFAAAYLEDALSDSTEEFLIALDNVLQARGAMIHAAKEMEISNSEFGSVQKTLAGAGFKFQISAA